MLENPQLFSPARGSNLKIFTGAVTTIFLVGGRGPPHGQPRAPTRANFKIYNHFRDFFHWKLEFLMLRRCCFLLIQTIFFWQCIKIRCILFSSYRMAYFWKSFPISPDFYEVEVGQQNSKNFSFMNIIGINSRHKDPSAPIAPPWEIIW